MHFFREHGWKYVVLKMEIIILGWLSTRYYQKKNFGIGWNTFIKIYIWEYGTVVFGPTYDVNLATFHAWIIHIQDVGNSNNYADLRKKLRQLRLNFSDIFAELHAKIMIFAKSCNARKFHYYRKSRKSARIS